MKRELKIFFTALMFYTRIPCPSWVDHHPDYLNLSTRYFPLMGWIVGGVMAGTYLLSGMIFNSFVSVIAAMVASVLLTGAFHEDGFADVCDGFGGGWTKEKILAIMKDSRLGTYGVTGLILLFSLKAAVMVELVGLVSRDPLLVILSFISVHTISRFIACSMIFTHKYVSEDSVSKAKPVAQQTDYLTLCVAFCFAVIPLISLIIYADQLILVVLLPILYMVKMALGRYFVKWIGGYTGDCLGAIQQVTEVVAFIMMVVIWKFI